MFRRQFVAHRVSERFGKRRDQPSVDAPEFSPAVEHHPTDLPGDGHPDPSLSGGYRLKRSITPGIIRASSMTANDQRDQAVLGEIAVSQCFRIIADRLRGEDTTNSRGMALVQIKIRPATVSARSGKVPDDPAGFAILPEEGNIAHPFDFGGRTDIGQRQFAVWLGREASNRSTL